MSGRWRAFFRRVLERLLKGAFICGSASCTDNPAVSPAPSTLRVRALALLLAACALPPAEAGGRDDHERARAAVQAGEVLPLPALLERLQRTHPGQVLELELERDDGRWVYEVKLLQADGQLLKLELDARTAQVLAVKRRPRQRDGAPAEPRP